MVDAAASSSYILPYQIRPRQQHRTCESAGFLDIENEAECEGAAALLGLRDTTVQNISQTPRFVVAVTNYTDENLRSQLYSRPLTFSAGDTFKVLSREDVAISPVLSPEWLVVQQLNGYRDIGVVPVDSMQTVPTVSTDGNLLYPRGRPHHGCSLYSKKIVTYILSEDSSSYPRDVGSADYLTFTPATNKADEEVSDYLDLRWELLCKREPPKPVLGYPTQGWVAGNRYLKPPIPEEERSAYLIGWDWFPRDNEAWTFTPETLSGYATLQLLPSWFILLGVVLVLFFEMLVILPLFLPLIWIFIFAISVGLAKLVTSRSWHATKERIGTHWAYVSAHNPLDQWLGVGVGEAPSRPGRQPVYMGWAENKARYRSNVVQGASLFLIPLVLIQIAVMDSTLFNLENKYADLVVAPCTYESTYNFTDQDVGSGLSGDGPADSSIVHPLAFRHEGICQAVADGHDCFLTDSIFFLQDSLESLFYYPPRYWNNTEPSALTCTPDGFVNVLDTCDEIDLVFPDRYVACFKMHEQTPMAWLDGLGIATGVVGLLIHIFDNLDWIFRIGIPEPDSKHATFSALQWCCCTSVRIRRQFFVYGVVVVNVGILIGGGVYRFHAGRCSGGWHLHRLKTCFRATSSP